jgi:nucleoside-diphosphate-sugar epimerase
MDHDAGPVFVTGASGFIGRHIVRRLAQSGFNVRALMRTPQELFDSSVEIVPGDLTKPATYSQGLSGASAIIHSALTENFSSDLQATLSLHDLGAQAGVAKFIHLSSIVVYGNPPNGIITETTPCVPSSGSYPKVKWAIEESLRGNSKFRELVILRLGCVYGPGGGWWGEGLLNMMQRGKLISVNGGSGIANLIHVSDIAAFLLLILRRSNPPFSLFNVTDGMPVPWSRYYSSLETIVGRKATASMSVEQAREYGRKFLHPSVPRRFWNKLIGHRRIHPLSDGGIDFHASSAIYSNQKAVSTLDFHPEYDLETGMKSLTDATGLGHSERWRMQSES